MVAVGLFTFLGVAVLGYLVRLAFLGRARTARLDRDGGSAFLSVSVMELGYWVLRPIVGLLHRLGATPNGVTLFAVVPGVGAAVAAANGWFATACLLGMTSAFCDALDGLLAQRKGGSTRGGQALDSILDRVTESALFFGIALFFHQSKALLAVCLLGLVGAYLTSYVSAKAEVMNVKLPRGVMRRAERAVYVLTASAFTPIWGLWVSADATVWVRYFPVLAVVGLVGLVANVSAAFRIRTLLHALNATELGAPATPVIGRRSATQELDPVSPGPGPRSAKETLSAAANSRGAA